MIYKRSFFLFHRIGLFYFVWCVSLYVANMETFKPAWIDIPDIVFEVIEFVAKITPWSFIISSNNRIRCACICIKTKKGFILKWFFFDDMGDGTNTSLSTECASSVPPSLFEIQIMQPVPISIWRVQSSERCKSTHI